MSSFKLLNLVIFLSIQLQLVLSDYDCLCYYGIEKTVYDDATQSNIVGYLYEFDCKPLEERDTDGHFGVAFDHKFGYVAKDDGDLQIHVCPGAPPAADILIRTAAPIVTSSTTATMNAYSATESFRGESSLANTRFHTSQMHSRSQLTSILSSAATSKIPVTTTSSTDINATSGIMIASSVYTAIPQGESKPMSLVSSTSESPRTVSAYTFSAYTRFPESIGYNATNMTITSLYEISPTSSPQTRSTKPSETISFSSQITTIGEQVFTENTNITAIPATGNSTRFSTIRYIETNMTSTSIYQFNPNSAEKTTVSPETGATQPSETANVSSLFTTTSGLIVTANANISSMLATGAPTIVSTTESSRQTTFNVGQSSSGGIVKFPDRCFNETTQTTDDLITGHVDLCPYKFLAESMYVEGTYPLFRQQGQYCYELRNGSKTWYEAERDCQHRGGFLVSIQNYSTLRLLKDLSQLLKPSYNYWIGLTNSNSHNAWKWQNGDTFECSSTWNVDGTYNVTSCTLMSSLDGSWTKSECSSDGQMAPWICQYKID